MHSTFLPKLLSILSLIAFLLAPTVMGATIPVEEAAKLLPDQLGEYRAVGKASPVDEKLIDSRWYDRQDALASATRVYRSSGKEQYQLTLTRFRSDAAAYAFLTGAANQETRTHPSGPQTIKTGEVGTAGIVLTNRILFFKGPAFVLVNRSDLGSNEAMLAFARVFAESLDKGDGDIPVLVKHLPNWEKAQEHAQYATTLDALKAASSQPIFEALSFEGGAQAVIADYGPSRLVIVENMTPQLASDNDARIQGRIRELREQGQSVPTAYERVGNYSVFVFDAPDEQAARQLIKSISYEQVVQWLGDNPRALERAQKQYAETTAGIILAVLKASGLSILLCLGIGGLFGGLVFRHRRAQQAATAAYSDAGNMVRLNIDGMTAQQDPARLLGRGEG